MSNGPPMTGSLTTCIKKYFKTEKNLNLKLETCFVDLLYLFYNYSCKMLHTHTHTKQSGVH